MVARRGLGYPSIYLSLPLHLSLPSLTLSGPSPNSLHEPPHLAGHKLQELFPHCDTTNLATIVGIATIAGQPLTVWFPWQYTWYTQMERISAKHSSRYLIQSTIYIKYVMTFVFGKIKNPFWSWRSEVKLSGIMVTIPQQKQSSANPFGVRLLVIQLLARVKSKLPIMVRVSNRAFKPRMEISKTSHVWKFTNLHLHHYIKALELIWRPGAYPTNDILIKFEIRPKFAVLRFKMYSTDHNEILHMSRQCNCHDMCKI